MHISRITQMHLEFEPRFKCLLLGDSGVGKTTFLIRHATGRFETYHVPTNGLRVHTLLLETDYQPMALELWDLADDAEQTALNNNYFLFAKCAIIMFDLNKSSTAVNVTKWLHCFESICGTDLPIVICGNKAELERMQPELLFRQQHNLAYCEISTSAAWNLCEPLKLLCSRLLKHNDLKLISQPRLRPAKNCIHNEDQMLQQLVSVRQKELLQNSYDNDKYQSDELEDLKRYIVLNRS